MLGVKSSIQQFFDGRLPATALLDLKGPSSAKAGIKKHSHTSNSNQSLPLFNSRESFHVNTTPRPKLYSRS